MDKFRAIKARMGGKFTTGGGLVSLLMALRMIMVNEDLWRNDEHFMIFVALVLNGWNGLFSADSSSKTPDGLAGKLPGESN